MSRSVPGGSCGGWSKLGLGPASRGSVMESVIGGRYPGGAPRARPPSSKGLPRRSARPSSSAAVVELLLPVSRTAGRREVEQVPERLDRAGVARVLARVGGSVEELGGPEVPDLVALAAEHVHHRQLRARVGLGEVVAVVRVRARRDEPQVGPPALVGEGEGGGSGRWRHPRSSAKARRRSTGAFATIAMLTRWVTCSAAPSSWSRNA